MESGAPKIDRENVEDELDRGDCLTIGTEEKFENENEEGGMYFRGFTKSQITVAFGLKFYWYLRTFSLKFQKFTTKIGVFLTLPS